MRRSLKLIYVALAWAALIGCQDSNPLRPTPIGHSLNPSGFTGNKHDLIGRASTRRCLNVEAARHELTKDDTTLAVLTSDLDVGYLRLTSDTQNCVQLIPLENATARAFIALQHVADLKPSIERVKGKDLTSSALVGQYLSTFSQDMCAGATIAQTTFKTLCAGPGMLTVGNNETEDFINYRLAGAKLVIEHYRPLTKPPTCPNVNLKKVFTKRTLVIQWEQLNSLPVQASLADLMRLAIKDKSLLPAKPGKPLVLNFEALNQLFRAELTTLSCGG